VRRRWKKLFFAFFIACFAWGEVGYAEEQASKAMLASRLGWVVDPTNTHCCFGYFYDPFVGVQRQSATIAPITVKADNVTFQQRGRSVLKGDVVISQPGREIKASTAYLLRDPNNPKDQSVDLQGQVVLHEPGKLIIGNMGYADLQSQFVRIREAYYRIAFGGNFKSPRLDDTVAWGKAEVIEREPNDVVKLKNASYTTCSPLNPTWSLHAGKIELNRDTGRGKAKNVRLDIKEVPVFYLPYFNFPIDKRRQTGLLFPTIATSNQQGFSFLQPFYWNIAPNYDDVITPAYYGNRGVQLNNDFRYLSRRSRGDFYFSYLPDDRAFEHFKTSAPSLYANTPSSPSLPDLESASNDRLGISWQHTTLFNEHWVGDINYNYVSDDYYLQNFSTLPGVVTPNQLLRQGQIVYKGSVWNFRGLLQNYLTLHPVNETPTQNQYNRMPELDLNANFPTKKSELNFKWDSQLVHFLQDTNPGAALPSPTGDRLNLQPAVSLPAMMPWGYVVPALQYQFTQYVISGQVQAENQVFTPSTINRGLPIFDIDSGLYFEKKNLSGGKYTQTLEPRLFYLLVPYTNQDQIPEFDTSLQPFGYTQLFLTNRFSGLDRMGDANQLSMSVTTRFLDQSSGQEVANLSVGQIVYFENRKVTYCTSPGCSDINDLPGATPANTIVSPIAAQGILNISRLWRVNGALAWDPTLGQTNNVSVDVAYHGMGNSVFNVGYNFLTLGDQVQTNPPTSTDSEINNLNQASASVSWPIQERWRIFSGLTYNISHVHAQNYLYGLEYDSCCWAMRVIGGRVFQSLNQNNNPVFNNTIFVQWQLKGLGNFGTSDPTHFLTGNIPGYRDTFGKTE